MSHGANGFPRGGVHPPESKDLSLTGEVLTVDAPKKVSIVVTQHLGKPSRVAVNRGDDVKVGQVLAQADGFISSHVHSPVSGKVLKIADGPVVGASRVPIIEIMNDGQYLGLDSLTREPSIVLGPDAGPGFLKAIQDAGVVGLGGAAFPTHVKLSPPKDAKVDTLVINGCECEPYLTADDMIMQTKPAEILAGCIVMAEIIGVKTILIGIEDNKPRAAEALGVAAQQQSYASFFQGGVPEVTIRVVQLRTRYPQGAEKQLIDALLHRKVAAGQLPFSVGVVVQNVGTALAAFEAVAMGKPLIQRVITVSGKAVKSPGNFLVPIGASVADVVARAGGVDETKLAAIVSGGPMMGKSTRNLDLPVVKGMSGILLLSAEEIEAYKEGECIRCGRCVQACPMNLVPCELASNAEFKLWDRGEPAMECVECGCCQYVCPSKRYLVQYNRLAKYHFRRLKK